LSSCNQNYTHTHTHTHTLIQSKVTSVTIHAQVSQLPANDRIINQFCTLSILLLINLMITTTVIITQKQSSAHSILVSALFFLIEQGSTSHSTHFRSFRRRWGDCGISQDCSHSQSPQCVCDHC